MQFGSNTKCFVCKSFVSYNKQTQQHEVINNQDKNRIKIERK